MALGVCHKTPIYPYSVYLKGTICVVLSLSTWILTSGIVVLLK